MDDSKLTQLSIVRAAADFRSGDYSPLELTELFLDRIDRIDGDLHSYITVTRESALLEARKAELELSNGTDRGLLHGIPIAIKDLFATKGTLTTANTWGLLDWAPSEDATVVKHLRNAGIVLLGKLMLHEYALSGPSFDTPFPPARNPWNLEHAPGGSSSGSGSATAAGLCVASLGSDTAGSIRGPASMCGIVGLKPTYGLVSRKGVIPLSWSLDHIGPLCRTVEDTAIVLQCIAGHDPEDPASINVQLPDYSSQIGEPIDGFTIGVPWGWLNTVDHLNQETQNAVQEAIRTLERIGVTIREVDATPFKASSDVVHTIAIAEAFAYHEDQLLTHPDSYGSGNRTLFRLGAFITATDYINAQRARAIIANQIDSIFDHVDALALPSAAQPAAPFGEIGASKVPVFDGPFNLSGNPAISLPCGFSNDGLPIGLQIVGGLLDETKLFRIASAYERHTPWQSYTPSI